MGGNQLRASGHEEFLAKATGLHNQGKCKQSFSANHTPNTCVKEHAGRHRTSKDISPEARRPWLLGTALVAPASPDRLAEDREGGGAIVRVRAAQLTHTFHLYTLVTVRIYSNADSALHAGLILLQAGGLQRSQDVVPSDPDENLAFDLSQSLITFRTQLFSSCKWAYEWHQEQKAQGLKIYFGSAL